jgi:hypothetical protein
MAKMDILPSKPWRIQKISEKVAAITIKKTVFKAYWRRQNSFFFVSAEGKWGKKLPGAGGHRIAYCWNHHCFKSSCWFNRTNIFGSSQ